MPFASTNPSAPRRDETVDGLRAVAAFAVVCLHTHPFGASLGLAETPALTVLGFIIRVLSLFAVPVFFMLSGFYFARRAASQGPWAALKRMFLRLGPAWLAWSLIYGLLPRSSLLRTMGFWPGLKASWLALGHAAWNHPLNLIFEGTLYHLWFIPALLLAASVSALLWREPARRLLPPLAVGFYLVGLLGQAYCVLPFCPEILWNTRVGPFFALLPFALGLRERRAVAGVSAGALIRLGLGLLFVEAAMLEWGLHGPEGHYYLGSMPLGLGLVRWAAGSSRLPSPRAAMPTVSPTLARLAGWGRLSFGVYLSHLLVLFAWNELDLSEVSPLLMQFLTPAVVYGCALGLTALWFQVRRGFIRPTGTRGSGRQACPAV